MGHEFNQLMITREGLIGTLKSIGDIVRARNSLRRPPNVLVSPREKALEDESHSRLTPVI